MVIASQMNDMNDRGRATAIGDARPDPNAAGGAGASAEPAEGAADGFGDAGLANAPSAGNTMPAGAGDVVDAEVVADGGTGIAAPVGTPDAAAGAAVAPGNDGADPTGVGDRDEGPAAPPARISIGASDLTV